MSTTYAGFLTDLNRLIDGEDVSVSELPTASLQAIVSLGERRVYRDIKSRYNEKAYAISTLNNLAVIPPDFEQNSVLHFGMGPLSPISEEQALQYLWDGKIFNVQYFAEAGANFIFAPAIGDGVPLQGRYFCRLPDLSVATLPTNALYLAEPDVFLYACLSESAPIFGQDKRIGLWEAKYTQILDRINEAKMRAAFASGRMQMRPSALLGGRRTSNVGSVGAINTYATDYAVNYS